MNSDATEAALGLLGLSPLNAPQSHPQPQPQAHLHDHVAHTHGPSLTSSSVGIAIDRTSPPHIIQSAFPPSLVPLKRKQPSPALSAPSATPLAPGISRDGSSTKPRQPSHPLATSLTPPINSNRPLPSVSTKSATALSQQHSQQHPFSPILTSSVPPQTPPTPQLPLPSPSTSQHPLALSDVAPPPDSDAISCICGFTYDDGFSIACDDCSRWCHAACFGIIQGGEVPEFWKCWVCDPALEVDKERAVKTQKGRLRTMRMKAAHGTNGGVPGATAINGIGGNSAVDEGSGSVGKPAARRKTSPGTERKSRRGSAVAAAIEGSGSSKKKRRALMFPPTDPSSTSVPPSNHTSTQPHAGSSCTSHPNGNGSAPPSSLPPTPITFPPDIYPNPSVYAQLLRVAKAWRGVTAFNPPSPFIHPPPKTYNDDEGYMRVDSQGYRDRFGYSMSPLDNTTPVILDENAGDIFVPRTVLRTDGPMSCFNPHSGLHSQYPPASTTCTPAHLRPPSPKLYVASDPSPFSHNSIYPSPPISNYMSPSVPSSSHPRPYAKSPLTPSTNTISSSNPNDTIPATTLLAPYTAAIVPSAAYLADPLNGYAHLGMGKPQVRLVGGGWEVGLDSRGVGGVPDPPYSGEKGNGVSTGKEDVEDSKARWARCGCWPNAVVRPVICGGMKGKEGKTGKGMRHRAECAKVASDDNTVSRDGGPSRQVNGRPDPPISRMQGQPTDDSSDQDDAPSASNSDADSTSLSFALFALRDLRADEEIVLGWEWDDGHAVHTLPALMESPGMFAPAHLHHLRAQFTSILHALSSTFTTCACGSSTRDCAVRVMERVVEGRWPWPGGEMASEGSEGDSSDVNGASEEWDDCEGDVDVEGDGHSDPRPSLNWGLGMNVDVDVDVEMDASAEVDRRIPRVKKRKVRKKSRTDGGTHVDGGKEGSAATPGSPLGSGTKKAIDLGPLVGVSRGFRAREKAPLTGGWGGLEIVPSSLKAFPEVRPEDDPNAGGKGKGKAQVADDKDDMDVDLSSSTLPPRMRKAWSRPPAGQPEPPQENSPHLPRRAESWNAHERWRSPPDASAESPISTPGAMEWSNRSDPKQAMMSVNGDSEDGVDGQETEFDTETEVDGSDDTRQMPPPPMPASLDPTTVLSLAHANAARSSSPRGPIQLEKNGVCTTWIPPQTPTSTSAPAGRSSQPPVQGTPTTTPLPAHSTIALSPLPPQAHNHTLSPSTSFPLATQEQVQSHPPPLVSSVSPSTTFSKLSLHSPDTSSSPHLSVLFGPSESTSQSSTPNTQRTTDHQTPSSPFHRPSKPLHVHPQNELPSLPAPISTSAVTLNTPECVRDTPAEAQYQQPYISSPEPQYEIHPSSDVEKRRAPNTETYRVRFASPDILSGLPRLRGNVTSDSSNSPGADDGASANANVNGVVNEQEILSLDRDAMDVDVAPVGDNQGEDGGGPAYMASPESKMDSTTEDQYSSSHVPGSPHPQVSPDPHSIAAVMDSSAPENDPSPPAFDVNQTTSQTERTAVEHEPAQPAREPSPPPPPKVKMSLKDFALRKKKQREEEEMAAKALRSPLTPDGRGLPSSPIVDVKLDRASEHADTMRTADSGGAVNGHVAKMNDATNEDVLDSFGTAHVSENGSDGGGGREHDVVLVSGYTEEKAMADGHRLSPGTQVSFPQPARSSPASPCVAGERNDTDQTRMEIDHKPPTVLTAKMEIMDAMVPNGLVGIDDCAPDVVSFAPEPPPPPLTTKQASETTTVDCTASVVPRLIPPPTPTSTSTSGSMSTSTSTSAVNSRSNSVGLPVSNPNAPPHAYIPTSSSMPPSRRPSHEDGEITSSTPPKTYLPRSHTPPTQPRSFHAVHPTPSSLGSTSTSSAPVPRRPAPPLSRSPLSNSAGSTTTPISSRPLPSGPRALRGSTTQSTHPPPYPSTRPPYTGSQYIPRGPSADRDRIDWERGDRQWAAQARPRGRAGSNGWGR